MNAPFRHKSNLNDLPTEMVLEVASYLDLEDITSLQQVRLSTPSLCNKTNLLTAFKKKTKKINRKMRKSINVHLVWLTLAKTYSARHFHVYQPQSGWFDDLTVHELRKWIRKRLHFDRIWETPLLQPRVRILSEPPDAFPVPKLVPGGRWLLAGGQRGVVWYCDLDSERLKWKKLIRPSKAIEGSDRRVSQLKTYADFDASELGFSLAFLTEGLCLICNTRCF